MRLVLSFTLATVYFACSTFPTGPVPGAHAGAYSVPCVITGTFYSAPLTYNVVAVTTGTIFVRLSWDHSSQTRLMFSVGTMTFAGSGPQWSPIVGQFHAVAGKTYTVSVDRSAAMAAAVDDPFTLSISAD